MVTPSGYSDPNQPPSYADGRGLPFCPANKAGGENDVGEIATILEVTFVQSGVRKQDEIHKYVEIFMRVVNKGSEGSISFEEFLQAVRISETKRLATT